MLSEAKHLDNMFLVPSVACLHYDDEVCCAGRQKTLLQGDIELCIFLSRTDVIKKNPC
jgi:hypothetical protein